MIIYFLVKQNKVLDVSWKCEWIISSGTGFYNFLTMKLTSEAIWNYRKTMNKLSEMVTETINLYKIYR